MSLPHLPILLVDDDFIIVNKPENMLSVPGKASLPPTRQPRYQEWLSSIKESTVDSSAYRTECKIGLEMLSKYDSVPRKQKPFQQFVKKFIKIQDAAILDEMWKAINSCDVRMHKVPLHDIPPGLISAAEIVDALYGKIYHVHRLDCATSGVLMFARSEVACEKLSRQFHDREVSKSYVAEVLGKVQDSDFQIDIPISSDYENRPNQKVDFVNGKASVTNVKYIEYNTRKLAINEHGESLITTTTLVELHPITGRTHQLRVHMSHIGYPILGDDLYSNDLAMKLAENRMHLHAHKLNFTHPFKSTEFTVYASCPFYHGTNEMYKKEDIVERSVKRRYEHDDGEVLSEHLASAAGETQVRIESCKGKDEL